LYVLCAGGLLTLTGCSRFKLYPVSGTAMLDGKPLTHCTVNFNPDASKGNTFPVSCVGKLDGQGHFKLRTLAVKASEGGPGAPLGWYKVTLLTNLPGEPEINVNPKYLDVNKTPLSVEIVENPQPGAYDLTLSNK
jgi:hypothetical protein